MAPKDERRIRRVVTEHDAHGNAVVRSDDFATNVRVRTQGGITSTLLWTTDSVPARYAADDRGAVQAGVAPPPVGTVFRIVDFAPADADAIDNARMLAEMGMGDHDLGGRRPPRHPAMHATDSVDYAIVLEGEIDMMLDDTEVRLHAGDVIVQQGTNHAWINRGERVARVAFVLMGAEKPDLPSR